MTVITTYVYVTKWDHTLKNVLQAFFFFSVNTLYICVLVYFYLMWFPSHIKICQINSNYSILALSKSVSNPGQQFPYVCDLGQSFFRTLTSGSHWVRCPTEWPTFWICLATSWWYLSCFFSNYISCEIEFIYKGLVDSDIVFLSWKSSRFLSMVLWWDPKEYQ